MSRLTEKQLQQKFLAWLRDNDFEAMQHLEDAIASGDSEEDFLGAPIVVMYFSYFKAGYHASLSDSN
jgi:hypothetical protein